MYKLSCVVAFSSEQEQFWVAEGNDRRNTVKIAQFALLFVHLLEILVKTVSTDHHKGKKINLDFPFYRHPRKLVFVL